MTEHTRRHFLRNASIGTAAVGAAALVTPALVRPGAAAAGSSGPVHAGPFVAWVKDVRAGEIAVMVGERTIVHQDMNLATQLARIAGQAR